MPAIRYDAYDLSTDSDPLYVGPRADQSDSRVSPKLGLVWQATPQFQVFANVAGGFKAPTPSQVNNGFTNVASGYTSIPNPNLRPETSRSYELGVRLRDTPALNGRLGAQLVAFKSDYDDFISQQQVAGNFTPANPAVFQFVNFSSVEVHGLEARANLGWDNGVYARFAGAWADGEQTTPTGTTALSTVDPIKLVWGLGYTAPSNAYGVEGVVTWSAHKDRADTDGLACYNAIAASGCLVGEAFALVDVAAYWNVTDQVTARIGVFNLFDETYCWWSDIRGVAAASPVVDAYTQPGRNVGLSLSLRL